MKKFGKVIKHDLPLIKLISILGLMYLTASLF